MLVYARLHFIQKLLTMAGPFSGQVRLFFYFFMSLKGNLKAQPANILWQKI